MSSSKGVRIAVVALVVILGGCSPAIPSPAPPSPATPVPSPSGPATSPVPTATPPAAPSPTPAGDGWTAVAAAAPMETGAALTAVSGDAYAVDPAAGFRLRATGDVPVETLLARLRVEPALTYDVVPADGTTVVLRPTAPLEAGAAYRFTLLDPAGAPVTGWAFQVAGPPRVVGTLPRDEQTEVPTSSGIEITFDRDGIQVGSADVVVRLAPEGTVVDGRVEMHGRAAVFVPAGPLAPGRVYGVTVGAGTGATAASAGLPRPVGFAFETARQAAGNEVLAELERAFTTCLVGERALVAARAWRDTPGVGYEEVTSALPVRVYRLAGESAAVRTLRRLLDLPSWAGPYARPQVATSGLPVAYSGTAAFVRAGDGSFALRLPFEAAAGWYLVELRQGSPSYSILQATDVAGVAGVRSDRLFAWANDAAAGGPLTGATVDILDGTRLGRTDATGLLVAGTPAGLATSPAPILARITARDGRRVVVHLSGAESLAPTTSPWYDWQPGLATWWTALSTDRWTYRPTDTINAWGFLRARADGRLPTAVQLRLWRETENLTVGTPITSLVATIAPTGAFLATIPIVDLPHGGYLVELVADGARVETVPFQVGDLRKPPYEFAVTAAPRALVVGDPVTATVTARFFDGTPAAGIPVAISSEDGSVVRGSTDTAGGAVGVVRLDPFADDDRSQYACPSIGVRTDGAVEADAEASVTTCVFRGTELVDAAAVRDGEAIVVSGSVHAVDFPAVEAALRRSNWWEADFRGSPVAGRRVALQVTEQVLRRVVSSQWYDPIAKQVVYTYDDEVVRSSTTTRTTTTHADGTFRLRLAAPSKNRAWEIVAIVNDAGGHRLEAQAYVGSPPTTPAASRYFLEVPGADAGFGVGDTVTARIARTQDDRPVAMPAGGSPRYLFLLLGPTRFAAVVSALPAVSTAFRATDEPGLQVSAVWFTGRGYATVGIASAPLRTADRRITVALAADRQRYEPGGTATVAIRTSDSAGRPVRATVLLRGVDQKLVAMGAAGFADPLELLYRPLAVHLEGDLAVSHPVWVRGRDDGKGSATGGGGGERSDLADALAPRLVTTDTDGRATAAFDLPDDITSWSVAATALTADRLAGSATVGLPVGLPFFVDATIAPEYLVGDRVSIRVRAFGSALAAGTAVRFTVSSSTLGMAPVTIEGTAFTASLVPLPALVRGTQRVTIAASSTAGTDRLVRTFAVLESRLTVGRRETVAVTGSVTPPGGPGLTTLVVTDAGRSRYLALLAGLAAPRGVRADEQLAASLARSALVDHFGFKADALPTGGGFARATYQTTGGGLAVVPYASADLDLTVRALVADPQALLVDSVQPWLRAIADDSVETAERRLVALVGLAALGESVLGPLGTALDDPATDGRGRLWAALGLALLGDRERAASVERDAVARWGERRGEMVRLRVGDTADEVSEATELLAVLAAWVDDPLAADALAYLVANPPRDDLAVLAEVAVVARLVARLPAEPAVVGVVEGDVRRILEIPAGGAVTIEVLAAQRAAMRLEPVSGSAAVTASWEEPSPAAADLGANDPDLGLTRTMTPASAVPANALVQVVVELAVRGPSRTGDVEVIDLLPSGLAPLGSPTAWDAQLGDYDLAPSRIEGQRVIFTVSFSADDGDPDGQRPRVPGTFRLVYFARVVTAGTYAWQPAVARQAALPGLVAVTPASTVELR